MGTENSLGVTNPGKVRFHTSIAYCQFDAEGCQALRIQTGFRRAP
jgi:hypothetical protein